MQQGLNDELYNSVHQYETNDAFTPREKLAAEFAERFATDHTSIGDELFARLKEHFTHPEILELTITIGYCVGIGRAFHVLDVARDFDVLWSREPDGTRPSTVKVPKELS
jgi:alkylhydroperoxidase family enzyme